MPAKDPKPKFDSLICPPDSGHRVLFFTKDLCHFCSIGKRNGEPEFGRNPVFFKPSVFMPLFNQKLLSHGHTCLSSLHCF